MNLCPHYAALCSLCCLWQHLSSLCVTPSLPFFRTNEAPLRRDQPTDQSWPVASVQWNSFSAQSNDNEGSGLIKTKTIWYYLSWTLKKPNILTDLNIADFCSNYGLTDSFWRFVIFFSPRFLLKDIVYVFVCVRVCVCVHLGVIWQLP